MSIGFLVSAFLDRHANGAILYNAGRIGHPFDSVSHCSGISKVYI